MKLKNLVRRMQKRGKEAAAKLKSVHYLDALYDSFRKKDMTRRAFKRAYKKVMDPQRMARDAQNLALHRQVRRSLRGM